MVWNWRLNLEPLVLECAKERIGLMMDSNDLENSLDCSPIQDGSVFEHNLRNGLIAVVMLDVYLESCVNYVLVRYVGFPPEEDVIRKPIWDKLELLFADAGDELKAIKGSVLWSDVKLLKRVRNGFVHYKSDFEGDHASYPPLWNWKIGGNLVEDFFSKVVLSRCADNVEELVRRVLEVNGLAINPRVRILGSDGSIGGMSYICTVEERGVIDGE